MKTIHSSLVRKGLGAVFALSLAVSASAQQPNWMGIAKGEYKYLGNISASNAGCGSSCTWTSYFDRDLDLDNKFHTMWSGVTAENAGKWGSVESTRGTYNFTQANRVWNNAAYHGHAIRFHTLVWGSQLPQWWYKNPQLTRTERMTAIENFIKATCQPFSGVQTTTSGYRIMIDVVNEPLNTPNQYQPEATSDPNGYSQLVTAWNQFTNGSFTLTSYPNGSGKPEYDWIIWSFEKARQHCPNSALVINEFNLFNGSTSLRAGYTGKNLLTEYKAIIKLLKDKDLIDGVGSQTHHFEVDALAENDTGVNTIMTNLNSLAESGLPLFITELDITGCTDPTNKTGCTEERKRDRYKRLFPKLWESNKVHGVTIWGAIQNEVWIKDSGGNSLSHLVTASGSSGSDTLTMTWLKEYFTTRRNNGTPSPSDVTVPQFFQYLAPERQFEVRAKGTAGTEKIRLLVNNQVLATWTLTTSMKTYFASSSLAGSVKVEFFNDATGRDVQVDYLSINGTKRQAESQPINTAAYQNGRCGGGSGRTEQMHCNGYINFQN